MAVMLAFGKTQTLDTLSFAWDISSIQIVTKPGAAGYIQTITDNFNCLNYDWRIGYCLDFQNKTLYGFFLAQCAEDYENSQTVCYQLRIVNEENQEVLKTSVIKVDPPRTKAFQVIPISEISSIRQHLDKGIKVILKLTFIPNGEPTKTPESSVLPDKWTFEEPNDLSNDMADLFSASDGSDVKLTVKGREFKVHKYILMARSPVFKRMFLQTMLEQQSGQVEIPDCNPEAFQDFLLYLYSGKVELTRGKVSDLYYISDKYECKKLSLICVNFMKQNFTICSFCDFLSVALLCSDVDLLEAAILFMRRHVSKILRSEEWKAFLVKNPLECNEFMCKVHDYPKSEK